MGKIDLHIHTSASDGENTCLEIEEMAEREGASVYAITDHDTVMGYEGFHPKNNGILFIKGVEITAQDFSFPKKSRFHILGYDMNVKDTYFTKFLEEQRKNSLESFYLKWEYLKKHYPKISKQIKEEEIFSLMKLTRNIGSPDLAHLMITYNLVESVSEAFHLYLKETNEETKSFKKTVSPQKVIEVIQRAGGLSSMAHPISVTKDLKKLREYLLELQKVGLCGIEASHYTYTKEDQAFFKNMCKKYDFLESAGTDYHGIGVKPDVKIFTGRDGNVQIDHLSMVEEIQRRNKVLMKISG